MSSSSNASSSGTQQTPHDDALEVPELDSSFSWESILDLLPPIWSPGSTTALSISEFSTVVDSAWDGSLLSTSESAGHSRQLHSASPRSAPDFFSTFFASKEENVEVQSEQSVGGDSVFSATSPSGSTSEPRHIEEEPPAAGSSHPVHPSPSSSRISEPAPKPTRLDPRTLGRLASEGSLLIPESYMRDSSPQSSRASRSSRGLPNQPALSSSHTAAPANTSTAFGDRYAPPNTAQQSTLATSRRGRRQDSPELFNATAPSGAPGSSSSHSMARSSKRPRKQSRPKASGPQPRLTENSANVRSSDPGSSAHTLATNRPQVGSDARDARHDAPRPAAELDREPIRFDSRTLGLLASAGALAIPKSYYMEGSVPNSSRTPGSSGGPPHPALPSSPPAKPVGSVSTRTAVSGGSALSRSTRQLAWGVSRKKRTQDSLESFNNTTSSNAPVPSIIPGAGASKRPRMQTHMVASGSHSRHQEGGAKPFDAPIAGPSSSGHSANLNRTRVGSGDLTRPALAQPFDAPRQAAVGLPSSSSASGSSVNPPLPSNDLPSSSRISWQNSFPQDHRRPAYSRPPRGRGARGQAPTMDQRQLGENPQNSIDQANSAVASGTTTAVHPEGSAGPSNSASSGMNPPHRRFPCPRPGCTADFNRPADIRRHIDSVHEKKKYPCEECGRQFSRRDALKFHVRLKHVYNL
ncbi:hypothetical protein HGRIS_004440 [Hohenbuehelia grisea]|uniref:C2H2-type domain-containing protein n=1 Tax=Hohenbuehelia grisea TaxID=104357 RepID=A0ABR3JDK0_9AGAR